MTDEQIIQAAIHAGIATPRLVRMLSLRKAVWNTDDRREMARLRLFAGYIRELASTTEH